MFASVNFKTREDISDDLLVSHNFEDVFKVKDEVLPIVKTVLMRLRITKLDESVDKRLTRSQ